MTIRSGTSTEIPQLMEIARSTRMSAAWSEQKYKERLDQRSGIVLIATEEDRTVGFIVAHVIAGECEIENVAVTAQHRRKGHGRALVGATISAARGRGCEAIWLEVRESNIAALALYKRLGFSETARRRRYYRDPEEDALVLKIRLS